MVTWLVILWAVGATFASYYSTYCKLCVVPDHPSGAPDLSQVSRDHPAASAADIAAAGDYDDDLIARVLKAGKQTNPPILKKGEDADDRRNRGTPAAASLIHPVHDLDPDGDAGDQNGKKEEEEEKGEGPRVLPEAQPEKPSRGTLAPAPSAQIPSPSTPAQVVVSSPALRSPVTITFELAKLSNCLLYSLEFDGESVVASSPVLFGVGGTRAGLCRVSIVSEERGTVDESWRPLYGVRGLIRNHYEGVRVALAMSAAPEVPVLILEARAYAEGAAFRLIVVEPTANPLIGRVTPDTDVTTMVGCEIDMDVGVDGTIYQDLSGENGFATHRLSDSSGRGWPYTLPMHPFTVAYDHGVFLAVTEASNIEFESVKFTALSTFQKVAAIFKRSDTLSGGDLVSPWLTFLVGRTPGALIEGADLVYNLNDPCAIEDPSWISVGKVFRDLPLSTESGLAAVDLASRARMRHILLDAGWYGPETLSTSDATAWLPQPKKKKLDLQEVIKYGKSKGVGVFLYVNDIALRRQWKAILPLYSSWGVAGIKFGFVDLASSKDTARLMGYVRRCADFKLMVNIHDNFRPSGYSRTYPNLVSVEGIRGDEHTEKSTHALMLPFVRYLGGFADNTFVFDNARLVEMGKSLTQQIALSIIYYNPLSHIFWYRDPWSVIKLYRELPPSLRHLMVWAEMPASWEDLRVVTSSIGDWITVARKDYLGNWYLATATRDARTLNIDLAFLEPDVKYTMERYQDNPATRFEGGIFTTGNAASSDPYTMELVAGGGDVAVFKRVVPAEHLSDVPTVNVLHKALGAADSRVFLFEDDPRHYRVCTLANVCADADQIYLAVQDPDVRAMYQAGVQLCQENSKEKPMYCRCFPRSLKPVFVKNFGEIGAYTGLSGHTWLADTWVNIHQIGHWMEQNILFHSVFLNAAGYNLPRVDRIAFLKAPVMNEVESFFYGLATSNLGYQIPEPPLFSLKRPICMQRCSTSGLLAVIATSLDDAMAFRATASKLTHANLTISTKVDNCPSPKTYILVRTEPVTRLRKFLNMDAVKTLLTEELGIVDLSVVSTSQAISAVDQAKLFGEFGLMISTHSSQLVFSIFGQSGAAIVEAAVTFFNDDFAEIAQRAGLFYRMAIGGAVPSSTSEITPAGCNKAFSSCRGEPECFEKHATCTKLERGEIKELDFEVDLEALRSSTRQAIDHLHEACGGNWNGVRKH